MAKILLFNKWDTSAIKIDDLGLQGYINLNPIIVPRTGGRHVNTMFWKSKNNIVERFTNKIMVPGHKGKKHKVSSVPLLRKGMGQVQDNGKMPHYYRSKSKEKPC